MGDAAAARPAVHDHLPKKRAPRAAISLCFDSDAADELQAADDALDTARRIDSAESTPQSRLTLSEAEQRYEAARTAAEAETITYRFQAIGRKAYEELLLANPVTPENQAEADRLGQQHTDYNPDTFPKALVAASLVDPILTYEDVEEMWDDPAWTGPELSTLWVAALGVNGQARVVDLGKGSGRTQP